VTRIDPPVGALARVRVPRVAPGPGSDVRRVLILGAAALVAVVVAAAATKSVLVPLVLIGAIVAFVLLGPEVCICLCVLASFGLMPFVNSVATGPSRLPYWLISFGLAAVIMLIGFAGRALAGERVAPIQPGVLLWTLAVFAAYTLVQMQQSDPMSAPSIATPFIAFPLAGLVTFVWLLHDHPLTTMQKLMPVVVIVAAAWAVMYVFGSAGCSVCQHYVGTYQSNHGLLPGNSRLYTWGQESFIGLVVLAAARTFWRPSRLWVGLTLLGILCVLLQDSRAQELALAGSLLVLLVWKFIHVPAVTRVAMAALLGIAVYVAVTSPVGQHIVTGVQGLQNGSGTGGYRVQLVAQYQKYWSFLGGGITLPNLDLGYNVDLGIPNTILVLGFLGAAIQIVLLLAAVGRGLITRSAIGIALAAVIVMVLLARPTLPFLETGPGAIAYGMTLGAIAALYIPAGTSRRMIASSRQRVDVWRQRRRRPAPRRPVGVRR
jgi:hypothetical protein